MLRTPPFGNYPDKKRKFTLFHVAKSHSPTQVTDVSSLQKQPGQIMYEVLMNLLNIKCEHYPPAHKSKD